MTIPAVEIVEQPFVKNPTYSQEVVLVEELAEVWYRIHILPKLHYNKIRCGSHIYVHQEPKNKAGRIHRCLSDMDVFLGEI